jgi:hypothetical protein
VVQTIWEGGFMTQPEQPDYEHCALCGKSISSLRTRSIGSRYFCAEDFDTIIFPSVEHFVSKIIERLAGVTDESNRRRRQCAEDLRPTSEFGGRVAGSTNHAAPYGVNPRRDASTEGVESGPASESEDHKSGSKDQEVEDETTTIGRLTGERE